MFENHRKLIRKIKELVKRKNYRLTLHAEAERDADSICVVEIEEALLHNDVEIIEDYPDNPRRHSFLLFGFTGEGKPIHTLCSVHEETLVMITVYRPDPDLWIDWRLRRERK
jgi:hypothetical protein